VERGADRVAAFLFLATQMTRQSKNFSTPACFTYSRRTFHRKIAPGNDDVFKIDYGCYVDLINTGREPTSLFEVDEGELIEVPKDDYRSIRRAILTPDLLREASIAKPPMDAMR
jgi:hypothetical protein